MIRTEPAEDLAPDHDTLALTDGDGEGHLAVASFDASGRPAVLEHRFVVENECHGWRLDRFLMKRMRRPAPLEPDVPRHVEVIATDGEFYVLDKPAGLPIHPTARYHYGTLTAVLR